MPEVGDVVVRVALPVLVEVEPYLLLCSMVLWPACSRLVRPCGEE